MRRPAFDSSSPSGSSPAGSSPSDFRRSRGLGSMSSSVMASFLPPSSSPPNSNSTGLRQRDGRSAGPVVASELYWCKMEHSPWEMLRSALCLQGSGTSEGPRASFLTTEELMQYCCSATASLAFQTATLFALSLVDNPVAFMSSLTARIRIFREASDHAGVCRGLRLMAQWATYQPWHFSANPSLVEDARVLIVQLCETLTASDDLAADAAEAASAVDGAAVPSHHTLPTPWNMGSMAEGVQGLPDEQVVPSYFGSSSDDLPTGLRGARCEVPPGFPTPLQVVKEWSLLDLAWLRQIPPEELIAGPVETSTHLRAFISSFQTGVGWLAARALSWPPSESKMQCYSIVWLIEVASISFNRKNFSLSVQVLVALCTPAVLELVDAWALVPLEALGEARRLAHILFSQDNIFGAYHGILDASVSAIPFLGTLLRNIQIVKASQHGGDSEKSAVRVGEIRLLGAMVRQWATLLHFYERDFPAVHNEKASAFLRDHRLAFSLQEVMVASSLRTPENLKFSPELRGSVLSLISRPNDLTLCETDAGMSEDDWNILFASRMRIPFNKGEVLIRRASSPAFLMRLVAGTCRAEVAGISSPTKTIATLGPCDICGISSVFNLRDELAFASVVAESEGIVDVVPFSFVRELCVQAPGFAQRLFFTFCVDLSRNVKALESSFEGLQCAFTTFITSDIPTPVPMDALAPHGPSVEFDSLPLEFRAPASEFLVTRVEKIQRQRNLRWVPGTFSISVAKLYFASTEIETFALDEVEECVLHGADLTLVMQGGKSKVTFRSSLEDWRSRELEIRVLFTCIEQMRSNRACARTLAAAVGPILEAKAAAPTRGRLAGWQQTGLGTSSNLTKDIVGTFSSNLPDASPLTFSLTKASAEVFEMDANLWSVMWASCASVRNFGAGDIIESEGAPSLPRLCNLVSGRCEIMCKTNQLVGRMSGGELFGEAGFFSGGVGTSCASIKASTECTVLFLENYVVRAFLSLHAGSRLKFLYRMACSLSTRLNAFQAIARQVQRDLAPEKKNSFLDNLRSMTQQQQKSGEAPLADLPLPDVSQPLLPPKSPSAASQSMQNLILRASVGSPASHTTGEDK